MVQADKMFSIKEKNIVNGVKLTIMSKPPNMTQRVLLFKYEEETLKLA